MTRYTFGVLFVLLAVVACAKSYEATKAESSDAMESRTAGRQMMAEQASSPASRAATAQGETGKVGGGTTGGAAPLSTMQTSQPDRYLIKNGQITLEVDDARAAAQQVSSLAQSAGGYVANRNESLPSVGVRTVNMQVRVPAKQFDQLTDLIAAVGTVIQRGENSEEVTEEFLDTDARARNLKATEQRLMTHLERATQLEEILRVEQEVTRVRQDVERLDGRLRFLSNRVDFSTIQVSLTEKAKAQSIMPVKSWSAGGVFGDAFRSLFALLQRLLTLFIWLLVWAVIWLPLALLAWFLVRRELRRTRKFSTPPPPPPAPPTKPEPPAL